MQKIKFFIIGCLPVLLLPFFSCNTTNRGEVNRKETLTGSLDLYQTQLNTFRKEFGGTYQLPEMSFYLFGMGNRDKYVYKNGLISDRDYPLTWETEACQADYEGMHIISKEYVEKRIAAPHTWHAAEVFLYLYGTN